MARTRKGDIVNGWVNVDKPVGLTSTQVVGKIRRFYNAQKAGHAGTLDPLASGILPVALGEATKTIPFVQDSLKTYSFTIAWGEQRDTDDSEGAVIATSPVRPDEAAIRYFLPKYTGEIMQTPPQYSAIKVDGQRAYDLARDGQSVDLAARPVYVEKLELVACRGDQADFTMVCGKGTYVRSLARDLALDLGTCGYIAALRRLKVGPFDTQSAISLDILGAVDNSAPLKQALLPAWTVLDDIPALALREDEAARLRNGQALAFLSRPDVHRLEAAGVPIGPEPKTALCFFENRPVAIVEVAGVNVKPVRVLKLGL